MTKILIAIDDSPNALHAVSHMIKKVTVWKEAAELHLINVQPQFHGGISGFVNADQIKQVHQEEGMKALAAARELLDQAGVPYQFHLFVGEAGEIIGRHANEQGYDEIVMGTRGQNPLSSLLLGSVASKVIGLASMPVLLVK